MIIYDELGKIPEQTVTVHIKKRP